MNEHDPLGFSSFINAPSGDGRTVGMVLGERVVNHVASEIDRMRAEYADKVNRARREQNIRDAIEDREARIDQVRTYYMDNERFANNLVVKRDAMVDLAYNLASQLGMSKDELKRKFRDHKCLRLRGMPIKGLIPKEVPIPKLPDDETDLMRAYLTEVHEIENPYVE